ncbi:putative Phosphatidylethanolamine-binding protein-like protein F40A3.3 [Hypsibius exemplaris]|uniref:Phosphatidylethanolamine-binding protein-like protein F40A3.3 n=1 Tax=Hypsibius exemplaris TaxID=2072580 RepID=A0A1W0XE24_HYPEX|nr:putative Phosphatidylethanolamine-binding protein-like protein F40A3.3 [Hypsibius exemplaris]
MAELKYNEHGIISDVIKAAPLDVIHVKYPSGVQQNLGNELKPRQVKDQPEVSWKADDKELYTLCLTDPDAPSRENPKNGEWKHWLVVNIPGSKVKEGQVLAGYVGSGPPEGSGKHRYVLLAYKQPGKISPEDKPLTSSQADGRAHFRIQKWADKHKLGDPIAGNFYLAEWDDYVPELKDYLDSSILLCFMGGGPSSCLGKARKSKPPINNTNTTEYEGRASTKKDDVAEAVNVQVRAVKEVFDKNNPSSAGEKTRQSVTYGFARPATYLPSVLPICPDSGQFPDDRPCQPLGYESSKADPVIAKYMTQDEVRRHQRQIEQKKLLARTSSEMINDHTARAILAQSSSAELMKRAQSPDQ